MARETKTCPGRTVWMVWGVFLGNWTQAEIQTAVTSGLCPVFMSGSALAECVNVVLLIVSSSLSFFSTQWQKVFSDSFFFFLLTLWAPLATLCPTVFMTSLLQLAWWHFSLYATQFSHSISCCVRVAAISGASYYNLFLFISNPEQGTDLIRWSISLFFSCCSYSFSFSSIQFVVSNTMPNKNKLIFLNPILNCCGNLTARFKH